MGVSPGNWRQARKASWAGKEKAPEAVGLRHGFRSGLEELNAKYLVAQGQTLRFENLKIPYEVPLTRRTYNPDFVLDNGIIVETKGKLEPKDRAKHILISLQHPGLDVRFVFQRPHDKIVKGSKTTYAAWAEKFGFKWGTRVVPLDWLKEPGPDVSPFVILNAKDNTE